jgi:Coenzyme PQQ synthesis protein D (PqqD)
MEGSSTNAVPHCSLNGWVRLAIDRDSGFLLDIKRGKYYKLNSTAARICNVIRHDIDISSVADALRQTVDENDSRIDFELWNFLRRLEDLGLCWIRRTD